MKKAAAFFVLGLGLLVTGARLWAHHGSAISYDTAHLWTTWATVTQFNDLTAGAVESRCGGKEAHRSHTRFPGLMIRDFPHV